MGLVVIKICIAIFFDHGSKAAPIREHLRSPGVSPWQTRSFLELSLNALVKIYCSVLMISSLIFVIVDFGG